MTTTSAVESSIEMAERLGAACAEDAYQAGGGAAGPWAETGVPREPQRGDWDYLRQQLTGTTRDEERCFAAAYAARLRDLVDG